MSFFLALCLLFSAFAPAAADQVELFDSDREKVVETFENSQAFQESAVHILNSVSGRVMDFAPSLQKVLIVKIPLVPPRALSVPKAGIDDTLTAVFVVIPKQGVRKPWLIAHTKKEETLLMEFTQELSALRQLIGKR
ncbi:MAG: hypothetical protein ACM32O_20060 [Clostridia bacterium]